jgi:hypothetical protein
LLSTRLAFYKTCFLQDLLSTRLAFYKTCFLQDLQTTLFAHFSTRLAGIQTALSAGT